MVICIGRYVLISGCIKSFFKFKPFIYLFEPLYNIWLLGAQTIE